GEGRESEVRRAAEGQGELERGGLRVLDVCCGSRPEQGRYHVECSSAFPAVAAGGALARRLPGVGFGEGRFLLQQARFGRAVHGGERLGRRRNGEPRRESELL